MPLAIADYALIGDTHTAALVGRDGAIDWLCLPRFDSGACLAALVGDEANGHWRIAPTVPVRAVRRRYRGHSLVLETTFETAAGTIRLTDFMPVPQHGGCPAIIRLAEGLSGAVPMRCTALFRFDYGSVVPWISRHPLGLHLVAGPDGLLLSAPVAFDDCDQCDVPCGADFTIAAGATVPFTLSWFPSHRAPATPDPPDGLLAATERWWTEWCSGCGFGGRWREPVMRSLLTLKALTDSATGGMVAAPTTSLPEAAGGQRNWDYRYCWLRDATFTLYALMRTGFHDEARAWRDWLLRAVAGRSEQVQIVYGLAGERRLDERVLPWLAGHGGARPVRVGNAAHTQFQLDVYGEVMDVLDAARTHDIEPNRDAWRLQRQMMDYLEGHWRLPDDGLWEVRGPSRQFTHSKVMAWVAVDRALRGAERCRLDAPRQRWLGLAAEIRADVLARGFDAELGSFVQSYGAKEVDAALLLIPLVGFLPCRDPRVQGTMRAVERELMSDGLVRRYRSDRGLDGLPAGEGHFLACSFWLADNWALSGRRREARALFERLLGLANDVGLLAEEADPRTGRLLGNFPQAFSHVALINTAHNLAGRRFGGPGGPSPRHAA